MKLTLKHLPALCGLALMLGIVAAPAYAAPRDGSKKTLRDRSEKNSNRKAGRSSRDRDADVASEFPCDTTVSMIRAKEGNEWPNIRIPALLSLGKGRICAFFEGRHSAADQSHNDIGVCLSRDGGKTWSDAIVVASAGENAYNNPCPVYDAKTKTIHVLFQSYAQSLGMSERGGKKAPGWDDPTCVRNWVCTSKDGGKTWSKPRDVTSTTKHPDGVDIMASGPNAGVQLTRGRHKGRLVIPMNEGPFGAWTLAAVYSDDHGKTWKIGDKSGGNGQVNETSIAETERGGVVVVSRKWAGPNCKRIAWSKDGGESWSPVDNATELSDGGTQNSLLKYSFRDNAELGGKSRLIYSGMPGSRGKGKAVIALSYDDGKTWPIVKQVNKEDEYFAYSSLVYIKPGVVGLLYEADHASTLKFTTFTIDWLTDGKDTGIGKKSSSSSVPKPAPAEGDSGAEPASGEEA